MWLSLIKMSYKKYQPFCVVIVCFHMLTILKDRNMWLSLIKMSYKKYQLFCVVIVCFHMLNIL